MVETGEGEEEEGEKKEKKKQPEEEWCQGEWRGGEAAADQGTAGSRGSVCRGSAPPELRQSPHGRKNPYIGVVFDAIYIGGQQPLPTSPSELSYKQCHGLLIAILPSSNISIFTITLYLLLSNLGASIVEVANDAIVAEIGRQPTSSSKKKQASSSGELQSFVWMASSMGGVLGNLLGGVTIDRFSSQAMFLTFGILLAIQFLITITFSESSLHLPKSPSNVGIRKQLSELTFAFKKTRDCLLNIMVCSILCHNSCPNRHHVLLQTQYLKIDSSVLGISKVFGQAAMLLWSIILQSILEVCPPRKLISAIQVTMAMFMLSDILFMKGIYRNMGMPDSVYVVIFSGLLEVLYFFKILAIQCSNSTALPTRMRGIPDGISYVSHRPCIHSSGYLGVALASYVGVTADDFSGMPQGLLIQAACTLVPLFWSSCIPEEKARTEKKD
ncbi:putative folate-biopterin transporter 7 [Vitis vinifera]|uniref:Putative folate-biopterin transporter 7 n=1 Tax=Vitis vinifera TaxID=29760 RepID=A0A438G4N9_VITVI|nr:putative folate-biopterin transporter 7 [Vitis vinifera]